MCGPDWPGTCHVPENDLELQILLSPPPACWDHRCVLSHLACTLLVMGARGLCKLSKYLTKPHLKAHLGSVKIGTIILPRKVQRGAELSHSFLGRCGQAQLSSGPFFSSRLLGKLSQEEARQKAVCCPERIYVLQPFILLNVSFTRGEFSLSPPPSQTGA